MSVNLIVCHSIYTVLKLFLFGFQDDQKFTLYSLSHNPNNVNNINQSASYRHITCSKLDRPHLTQVTSQKPLPIPRRYERCENCGRTFVFRKYLLQHLKECLSGTSVPLPLLPCNQCEATFTDQNTLDNHKRGQHGGRVYRCVCGETYRWRSSLRYHLKIHNCGRPSQFMK